MRRRLWILAVVAGGVVACRESELPEVDGRSRELAAGQRIYERKCASCHGVRGDGKTVTAGRFPYANLIDGKWRSDGSPEAIERQVRRGRDPMPRFEGKLTDAEIRQVVEYVVELSRGRIGPGRTSGR
ncbi:MAG TPA: cytochrome c [Thermoanaerobaculia bacterium]